MQEACGLLDESQQQQQEQHDVSARTKTIALGMPVLSARKRYDGEEDDDMRVVQVRRPTQHPSLLVFVAKHLPVHAYRIPCMLVSAGGRALSGFGISQTRIVQQ